MNNLTVKTKEAQFSVACENAECNDLFRRIVKKLSAKLMGTECGKSGKPETFKGDTKNMSNIFITPETLEAISDITRHRDKQQMLDCENQLYKMLSDGVRIAKQDGTDFVIRVIDRKVGKTYCLARAAIEYNLPVVANGHTGKFVQQEAMRSFGKSIKVISLSGDCQDIDYSIVLKEECATVEKIKRKLGCKTVIVGFASMYE